MARKFSGVLRDARANVIESTIGASPILEIRTGAPPADCAAADTGTLLVSMTLPADWLTAAAGGNGQVAKNGTWSGVGVAAGVAGHYRIKNAAGTVCHEQGTAGTSGTDMILDNANIAVGQNVTVTTYTSTEAGA